MVRYSSLSKSAFIGLCILHAAIFDTAQGNVAECFERQWVPLCEVPVARSEENIVVIRHVGKGFRRSDFVLNANKSWLFKTENIETYIVDVEVGHSAKPLYVVLSAERSVVWRFTGAVSSVGRVVAFGSERYGSRNVAIVGLAPDKIVFPSTSEHRYSGTDRYQPTDCSYACYPGTYLFRYPTEGGQFAVAKLNGLPQVRVPYGGRLWRHDSSISRHDELVATKAGPIPKEYMEETPIFLLRDENIVGVRIPEMTKIQSSPDSSTASPISQNEVISPPPSPSEPSERK